jgi:hypothetical protein
MALLKFGTEDQTGLTHVMRNLLAIGACAPARKPMIIMARRFTSRPCPIAGDVRRH